MAAHDTFAAIEQMEVARDLGDHDPDHAQHLAALYDGLGEPEMAEAVLAAAVKPDSKPALLLAHSQALLKLGLFAEASEAVHPLIAQWSTLANETRQYVARSALLAGDADAAGQILKLQPETSDGTDPEWPAIRGLQALLEGQARKAVDAFASAVKRNPSDAWNATLLGRACQEAGDSRGALNAWGPAVQPSDAPPEALIGAATLLAQANRLDEADQLLTRVANEDRRAPTYWQAQSLVAGRRKQFTAEQAALGYMAYNSGDPWRAEAIWQASFPKAKEADARELCVAIFNSAFRREDPRTALRYAGMAVSRRPKDPYLLKSLAEFQVAQNLLAEALATAQRFQAVAPPNQQAQAAELLSRIALDSGKPDLLQQSAQRNRDLAPNDPLPLLHLAEWQYSQGRSLENLERTLKLYQQASAVAPDSAEAAARAGIVLNEMKRVPEALSALLHALTLAPRVLEGTPNALLAQLEARQGLSRESAFETRQYMRLRALKDAWPNQIKAMRQESPEPGLTAWKRLAQTALDRHETWVALCASRRATRLAPHDPASWRLLAAANKRFGWFFEALDAMRQADRLTHHTRQAGGDRS
jgi:tetratricopeptide (TPR) repeat protein